MAAARDEGLRGWKVALLACGLAVAGALAMLFLPLGKSVGGSAVPEETHPPPVVRRFNLLEAEGVKAVVIAMVPIALAAATLPFRRGRPAQMVRLGAAVLLSAFVVLGLVTIGLLFLPAAATMWAAAFL